MTIMVSFEPIYKFEWHGQIGRLERQKTHCGLAKAIQDPILRYGRARINKISPRGLDIGDGNGSFESSLSVFPLIGKFQIQGYPSKISLKYLAR